MIFTHRDDGPDACDPTVPGGACGGCEDAYLASGAEDRHGESCRCEPGDRHPLCPEHGEHAVCYEAQKRANRAAMRMP